MKTRCPLLAGLQWYVTKFIPLPNKQISDWSKYTAFASGRVENLGKKGGSIGKNDGHSQFFAIMFSKDL